MDTNFDFLGALPEDESVQKQTSQDLTDSKLMVSDKPGAGSELGEPTLNGFEEGDNYVTDTTFKPLTPTEASFDPRLAYEVALGYAPPEDIFPRYGMSEDDWHKVAIQPSFKNAVLKHQQDILENGVTFRAKAKVQAEAYLKDAHLLVKHPMTPPTVKANMIQWMAKVADLEPRKEADNSGTTFNLQINL